MEDWRRCWCLKRTLGGHDDCASTSDAKGDLEDTWSTCQCFKRGPRKTLRGYLLPPVPPGTLDDREQHCKLKLKATGFSLLRIPSLSTKDLWTLDTRQGGVVVTHIDIANFQPPSAAKRQSVHCCYESCISLLKNILDTKNTKSEY